jgi:SAM-dependent MidA family methyltransferase
VEVTPGLRRQPPPDLDAAGQDDALIARIRTEIEDRGPMTFDRFMTLALYDAEGGYYRSNTPRPGRDGDFLTAPEAHAIFGWAIARAVADAWNTLDRPATFTLREYGSGTGALGLAILTGLGREAPDLATILRYEPIEVDPRRLTTLRARFDAAGHADRLAPSRTGEASPIAGVVLANEVLDALPTQRIVMRAGELREIKVGWAGGEFIDVEAAPSTPALAHRLAAERIVLAEGQHGEICLEVDGWIAAAAGGLERGLLLAIDYGYPAAELYDPVRRPDGTLRAYLRHTVHDDVYRHVGRQDLTAHVDVTAVEAAAQAAGLTHLGTTTQGEFLAGLGAGDLLRAYGAEPATTIEDYLTARSSLLRMIDPAAMGRFRVMAFGRRWPDRQAVVGLEFRTGR